MSKLNEQIKTNQQSRVAVHEPLSLLDVHCDISHPSSSWDYYQYDVRVTLGDTIVCRKEDLSQSERIMRQRLLEHVFGEFREPLYAARVAIMQADRSFALNAIDKIIHDMFEV